MRSLLISRRSGLIINEVAEGRAHKHHLYDVFIAGSVLFPIIPHLAKTLLAASSSTFSAMAAPAAYRIGHGYDLHRLEARPPQGNGRVLILAGVQFLDHPRGPISHSDGDAVYHAVTDAILGALGMPDIGQLFPDTDPRHENADSAMFLREARTRMAAAGYTLGNIDITVICERPKLGRHKKEMAANIASALDCETSAINLKGKTHEQVDAVGEGRAVEVHVVALLTLRDENARSKRAP